MPTGIPEAPLIDRFMKRVNKEGTIVTPELGNCWEWTGRITMGYGSMLKKIWGEGLAHRWSYKYHNKLDVLEAECIRHKCDNRKCVNPLHLEPGTRADNNQDMRERHPQPNNRKFTEEQIVEIKFLRNESKMSYPKIASLYSCNKRTIERIFTGKYYF